MGAYVDILRMKDCSVRMIDNYQVNVHSMEYHQIEPSSEIEQ